MSAKHYTDAEMSRVFYTILTKGRKDNTYKFALARYILDYSTRPTGSLEVPYSDIASAFLKYYWHQECKFKIKQNFQNNRPPSVIRIIREVFGTRYIPTSFRNMEKKSGSKIQTAEKKILAKVFGNAKTKTSLVIPRFHNLRGDYNNLSLFYDYDDSEQMIYFRPGALEFFRKNYSVLSKLVILEWAKFLEKTNTLPKLVAKIESVEKRHGSLTKYVNIYKDCDHCFYCNTRLEKGLIHVDHFIPWSYIFDDNAWNLVLSCQRCNLKKSDALAQQEFLKELILRNKTCYDKISILRNSLDSIDYGNGWQRELWNNYSNCKNYGFVVTRLP